MPAAKCDKCSKSLSLVSKWYRCKICTSWFCPSCMDRYCRFCKGEVEDQSPPHVESLLPDPVPAAAPRWLRLPVGLGLFGWSLWFFPQHILLPPAAHWYAGGRELHESLGRGVADWIDDPAPQPVQMSSFGGRLAHEDLFNASWLAGMGFAQLASQNPSTAERSVALLERSIERALSKEAKAFSRQSWGSDPLESMGGEADHGAYLPYLNILLSLHRGLKDRSRYAPLNDQITSVLIRRIEKSPYKIIHSSPDRVSPADNAAAAISILLYERAAGGKISASPARAWLDRLRKDWLEPETGLVRDRIQPATGVSSGEGSGAATALCAYLLLHADPALSKKLYESIKSKLYVQFGGLALMLERPLLPKGPGMALRDFALRTAAASVLALSVSRVQKDEAVFLKLASTAELLGGSADVGGMRKFSAAGPLGDSAALAVFTARERKEP